MVIFPLAVAGLEAREDRLWLKQSISAITLSYGPWFWCKVMRDHLDLLDPSLTTASPFQTSSQLASLHCRCNLNPVISNVCKTVLISLFWASYRLNKLLEVRFEFPFNLIGKLTNGFFNRIIMVQ